jgi:hypothetical protein
MLIGIPPHYTNDRQELFNNIEKQPIKLPNTLSNEARSLLKAVHNLIKIFVIFKYYII